MAPTGDLSQELEPQPQRVEIVFAGFKVDLNLTSVFLKITISERYFNKKIKRKT